MYSYIVCLPNHSSNVIRMTLLSMLSWAEGWETHTEFEWAVWNWDTTWQARRGLMDDIQTHYIFNRSMGGCVQDSSGWGQEPVAGCWSEQVVILRVSSNTKNFLFSLAIVILVPFCKFLRRWVTSGRLGKLCLVSKCYSRRAHTSKCYSRRAPAHTSKCYNRRAHAQTLKLPIIL